MGFRNPELFWLGLLALPLILFYILKVRRAARIVSSVLLWREALTEVEAQVPFRRLRRDWLLLLQLLALALAVLAAAGPYRRTLLPPGERTAIVVDASAGMRAGGRIDQARREAARLAAGKRGGDEFLVVRAGARPEVLAPLTADRVVIDDALARLEAAPAPADLGAALRLSRSILGPEGALVLITDGATAAPDIEGLIVRRVGSAADNVGIVALGVRPSNPSGRDHDVFVRLRNASRETVEGTIEVLLEGAARDASSVRIEPGGEAGRTLGLLGAESGVIEARWRAGASDAFSDDDRAWWVLRPPRPRGYRVIGEGDPYLRHALAALAGWVAAPPGQPADLEVIVRGVPSPEGPPFLWIDPAELRRGTVDGPPVLTWERTHPLLRFLNLHPVRLGRVPVIERPPGARVLAESGAGPLILEGARSGRRCVIWAFDPMQTTLPVSVSFPLLVHNALEFLVPPDSGLPGGVATGAAPRIAWPRDAAATLIAPSGRRQQLAPSGGVLRLPSIDEIGVFTLESGDDRMRFAASLLSPEESDLRPRGPVPADAPGAADAAGGGGARRAFRDLWLPIALLVLGLVLLEGAAFHRRWTP